MSQPTIVEIDGHDVKLTNLDKVLYPSGFTKAEVIDYFVRVAPTATAHPRVGASRSDVSPTGPTPTGSSRSAAIGLHRKTIYFYLVR